MPSLDSMMMREIIMDHYENPRNHGLVDDKKLIVLTWILKLVSIISMFKHWLKME